MEHEPLAGSANAVEGIADDGDAEPVRIGGGKAQLVGATRMRQREWAHG